MHCFEPKHVKVCMCILTFQVSVSAEAEAHYLCLLQACLSGMASSFGCVHTCCSFVSSFFLPAAAPLSSTSWLPFDIYGQPSFSSLRFKKAQNWPIHLDPSISVSNCEVWSGIGAVGTPPDPLMSCMTSRCPSIPNTPGFQSWPGLKRGFRLRQVTKVDFLRCAGSVVSLMEKMTTEVQLSKAFYSPCI